uniref:Uncharacterized protein n=1 Tax=Romanomermis culicivorax TaxID=13658 RepID=A0A915IXF5_ROMCU
MKLTKTKSVESQPTMQGTMLATMLAVAGDGVTTLAAGLSWEEAAAPDKWALVITPLLEKTLVKTASKNVENWPRNQEKTACRTILSKFLIKPAVKAKFPYLLFRFSLEKSTKSG